jgi:Rad3-related DNA helicase
MGTWNTSIKGNDTFLDIYQNFFGLYNQGQEPNEVSAQIINDFSEQFDDDDDRNNSIFGLALAQWETKSLTPATFNQVKEIIESGDEIDKWRELGADEKTLKKRQIALEKFLAQISKEKGKPKRRITPKLEFEKIELVKIFAPDNKKVFEIGEEIVNKNYVHTGGIMSWGNGGGSVLYFTGQGQAITAKWLDSQTLEIIHDKEISFSKKDESAYFCGDDIKITYKAN